MRKNFAVPTVPMVLSLIALIVSVSGTAVAATTVIVTKNKQVASHVIAGSNAPKGDNKNIIPGSLGSADLHANSVTGAKVATGSLSGSDLANGSVTAAKLGLPKFRVSMPDHGLTPVTTTVVAVDGLALSLTCVDSPDAGHVEMHLTATSSQPGAVIRGSFDGVTNAGPVITGNLTTDTNAYTLQNLSAAPVSVLDSVGPNISAANLTAVLTYSDSADHIATVLMDLGINGTSGGAFTCRATGNVIP
jgi:hypothetical protein